jgi:hypothetical protein
MQLAEYVPNQDGTAREAFYSLRRIEAGSVVVPFDGQDWRNLFQPGYYLSLTDIACMNNQIDVVEEPNDGLVKLAMRIRDHAYCDGLLHFSLPILYCGTWDPRSLFLEVSRSR